MFKSIRLITVSIVALAVASFMGLGPTPVSVGDNSIQMWVSKAKDSAASSPPLTL